jgi:hypothetical protein
MQTGSSLSSEQSAIGCSSQFSPKYLKLLHVVSIKLDAQTLQAVDGQVEKYYPFCEGRSSFLRVVIQIAMQAVADGRLPFELEDIQRELSQPRAPRRIRRRQAEAKRDEAILQNRCSD